MRGGSDICVDHCVPEIARYVSFGKAQARGHWCSHEDRSTSRLQFRCIESCVKFARCASRQARRSWVLAGRRLGNCARGEKKARQRSTGAPACAMPCEERGTGSCGGAKIHRIYTNAPAFKSQKATPIPALLLTRPLAVVEPRQSRPVHP